MNWLTRIFLVLLRLAIGWHFFFEGVGKLPPESWPVRLLNARHPIPTRDQATKPAFSGENYLRESAGPFGKRFRKLAGDSVIERMQVADLPRGENPARVPANLRMPPALERDWDQYFQRFVQHYQLTDMPLPYLTTWNVSPQVPFPASLPWYALYESGVGSSELPNQRRLVQTKFEQMKYKTATWLMHGTKTEKREGPNSPPVEIERDTQGRIKDYQRQLEEARQLQEVQMALFGPDVNARLRDAKAKANRMRAELKSDLDQQTLAMKKALHVLLTEEQKSRPLEPQFDPTTWEKRPAAPADPIPADFRGMTALQWADWTTRWGVFLVGVCLLFGLFSRTACAVGAGFLLMFYLAMPPLPGLPDNPRVEGTYLYINKNFIEMLALLTLATTSSGRWIGLDGLLFCLNPFRWGGKKVQRPCVPVDSPRETPPPPEPPPVPVDLGRDTPRPDLAPEPPPSPAPEKPEPEPTEQKVRAPS